MKRVLCEMPAGTSHKTLFITITITSPKARLQIPARKTADGIVVEVKVQPRSSRKGVAGVSGGTVKVNLTAPPVEGEANRQLVEVLADAFGVRKCDVEILKGGACRNKVVLLRGL